MDFILCSVFKVRKQLCNYIRLVGTCRMNCLYSCLFKNGAQWSELSHFDIPVYIAQPCFFSSGSL